MTEIPFGTTDWSSIDRIDHEGQTGVAYWRTQEFSGIRVRMVEYSPGYLADHWCMKGHMPFVSKASCTLNSKMDECSYSNQA